jgi:hypothetical protein
MYLYQTTIYKNPEEVAGFTAADIEEQEDAKTDFETPTKKDLALKITSIEILETTMVIDCDYETFDSYITGGISWEEVNYTDHSDDYGLYLLSEVIL